MMVSDDRVICVVANCKALSPADWESCWEKNTQDFAIHFVVYQIYKSCKNYDLFNLALRVLTQDELCKITREIVLHNFLKPTLQTII